MQLADFLLARTAEDEADIAAFRNSDEAGWWSPERMRAEVKAKRGVVGIHITVPDGGWDENNMICADDGEDSPCPTLRALALPYADHPDYRAEWRA